MAVKKKPTWKSMIMSCFLSSPLPSGKKAARTTAEAAMATAHRLSMSEFNLQRVSGSDPSNLGSRLSEDISNSLAGSNLYVFTLAELKVMTQGFSSANFIGEGGFGPVHKGFIDDKLRPGLDPHPVAVKLLDLDGVQGHREWLAEVIFLGQLRHPHLVKLIGYTCEDEHRVLVYEYMPRGSLENQLFRRYSQSLPWSTRMKIALGAAKGLSFLHEAEKPVIYRDFKASNILLDSDHTPKLSDFGLAKDGPLGDDTHVSTRVMGTQGYAAPEYVMTGHLTAKSDVYSYGVVLLELLTGRRSVDKSRPHREQNLVEWARPILAEPRKVTRIMDPRLEGQYSETGAQKAAALAYQCLNQRPKHRPSMSAVVATLEPLTAFYDVAVVAPFVYTVSPAHMSPPRKESAKRREHAPPSRKEESAASRESSQLLRRGGRQRQWQRHRNLSTPKSNPTVFSEEKLGKELNSPLHDRSKEL